MRHSNSAKDVSASYEEGAAEFSRQLFGRNIPNEDLAAAVGAPDGSNLNVTVRMNGQELHVEVIHPWIKEQRRGFRRDDKGNLFIWNHRLEKDRGAPPGFGLKVFARQVAGARRLGVKRIELWAAGNARDGAHNGYYTWARFGFDAPLSKRDRLLLPDELVGAKTTNDLMKVGAAEWWKKNGDDRSMVFDLADDSSMMAAFKSYLNEKGVLWEE
jgi:hypothetical protein